jgi:DNA helicase HerA-like ATPase
MGLKETKDAVGIILSSASTQECTFQLLESAERGGIREGMLLIVQTGDKKLLGRVAQIVPYNAFYTEGDPWSEARRKGVRIPEEIARRYEICKLDLLTEIPKAEIKYPPQPGDQVFKLDLQKHAKDIFDVAIDQKGHVWFGTLAGYIGREAPIPLNIENIPMHLAIFGTTGSGKSFDTGALIEKLVKIPVKDQAADSEHLSYPMIVIDAHGDYTDYVNFIASKKDKSGVFSRLGWIKRYVFPSTHSRVDMRTQAIKKYVQPLAINLDLISQREIAEIIMLYYKGTTEGTELPVSGLDSLFDWMDDQGYASKQDLFVKHYDDLIRQLNSDGFRQLTHIHDGTRKAVERALDYFRRIEQDHKLLSTDSELKKAEFVDKITKEGGMALIDFSADGAPGVDLPTKQLVMTYLASLLFERFTLFKSRGEERYLMFVIEEAQNFAPDKNYPISSTLAHSKLSSIATQGRKFGLSLCLISQRPSFVDRIVLSMCNSFIVHRISPEDIHFVKAVTGGLPESLSRRLTTLDRGEMIVTGQMSTVSFPLDIVVMRHQRMVPHTIGQTRVVESLAGQRGIK